MIYDINIKSWTKEAEGRKITRGCKKMSQKSCIEKVLNSLRSKRRKLSFAHVLVHVDQDD